MLYRIYRIGAAQPYECQSAWNVCKPKHTQSLWTAAARAAGLPHLADDPRFADTAARASNQDALRILLEEAFATRTTDEMLAAFRAASVPCAPINSYSDALVDAQIAHMGLVQQITLPNGVTTKTLGSPVRIDGAFLPITRDPPGLGAHNEEIARSVESIADSAA